MTVAGRDVQLAVTPVALALSPELTPDHALHALHRLPGLVFLDSSRPDGDRGRYSYLTADPFLLLRSRGRACELVAPEGSWTAEGDPFAVLQELLRRYPCRALEGLPPFQGGAAGYWGYDLGRQVERLPATALDDAGLPEMLVGLYDWVLAWDHLLNRVWLCATGLPAGTEAAAQARLAAIARLLDTPFRPVETPPPAPRLRSNFRRAEYLRAVERALKYIEAGDIYQVNLSQRFTGEWAGDPLALYHRLRTMSPVPYGAYLDFWGTQVLSASPECFLRFDGRRVETHPIKGTRPRGATPAEDERLAAELHASVKDRAENVMIVDLLRNDLGKVCRIGSVEAPRLFAIEGYSHVWQMVSTVTGELSPQYDAVDLLRACFPGGSVTGCPKIRAMEIIEELEGVRRGVYCGAIGAIGFSGAMTTSIVIRTLVLHGGKLYLQVGGAIVADSDPADEYAETLAKAAALVAALDATLEED